MDIDCIKRYTQNRNCPISHCFPLRYQLHECRTFIKIHTAPSREHRMGFARFTPVEMSILGILSSPSLKPLWLEAAAVDATVVSFESRGRGRARDRRWLQAVVRVRRRIGHFVSVYRPHQVRNHFRISNFTLGNGHSGQFCFSSPVEEWALFPAILRAHFSVSSANRRWRRDSPLRDKVGKRAFLQSHDTI